MERQIEHYAHVADSRPMNVLTPDAATAEWRAQVETIAPHRSYRLTLLAPDEREWSAEQADVFGCLLALRDQIEPFGPRLCCNGARRGAWASGMQRDMGIGMSVYLLAGAEPGQPPPQVRTLDPAPAESIVSVQEQRAWYSEWLARRSRS